MKKYSKKKNKSRKGKTNKKIQKGSSISNKLHIHLTNATNQFIEIMKTLPDIKWFFIEGTLISVLRYGANYGKIGNRINLVDSDIDIMVVAKSHQDWLDKITRIANKLMDKRWFYKEWLTSTGYYKHLKRKDKLKIYYPNNESCAVQPHMDIHSLIDDGINEPYIHEYDRDTPGSKSWPFYLWGGSIKRDIIFPLQKTYFNGYLVNIPNNPIELLSKWNNYEYGSGCLLYPFPVKKDDVWYSFFQNYLESDLTEEELKDIENHTIRLNNNKLPSLYQFTKKENNRQCRYNYFNAIHN
jgi:hypothetical protein